MQTLRSSQKSFFLDMFDLHPAQWKSEFVGTCKLKDRCHNEGLFKHEKKRKRTEVQALGELHVSDAAY
jgi:hypothetical protein